MKLLNSKLFYFFLLIIFICPFPIQSSTFNKVIIWGHKLHSSTHSYVHFAFYKTFKHLGYDTYWLDNNDNINNFDFTNSLFLTEGQVDQKIPLRQDCRYILHNCDDKKYLPLKNNGNCIWLQVYTTDAHTNHTSITTVAPFIMYNQDAKVIYMPWATDLLPHEIDAIKIQTKNFKKTKDVYWVGTICDGFHGNIDKVSRFKQSCAEHRINFHHVTHIDPENNISLIQQSFMAPAIQGKWQCEKGYIPCRIFKNISYGQYGITNSKYVYELFEHKILFNEDTYQLCNDAYNKIINLDISELHQQMDFVRDNHTYINRINVLLDFIHLIKPLNQLEKQGK